MHSRTTPFIFVPPSCGPFMRARVGPTKYLVGTEQGIVLTCNLRKKPAGGVASTTTSTTPAAAASASSPAPIQPASGTVAAQDGGSGVGRHHGPIYAIQRNPLHPTVFLTVGDWSARIWSEKNKGPILVTPYAKSYLTAGSCVCDDNIVRMLSHSGIVCMRSPNSRFCVYVMIILYVSAKSYLTAGLCA